MGLGTHALALGVGYVLGHPAGRERARKVPAQVRQLAARPEAAQLAEKSKSLAGQAVQTAKQRLGRSDADTSAAGSSGRDSLTTADTGRITAEDGSRRRRRFFVRPRRVPGGIDVPTAAAPGVVVAETSTTPAATPAADVPPVRVTDPEVAERTEAAMHGTLPPAGRRGTSS